MCVSPPATKQTLGVAVAATPVVQCRGSAWPSKDSFHTDSLCVGTRDLCSFPASLVSREDGAQGHPHREDLLSSPACCFSPKQSVSLSEGLWLLWLRAWRGKSLCIFFSVFFSVFSVSSFAQTCEHQRAGEFQTRTLPRVCAESEEQRECPG